MSECYGVERIGRQFQAARASNRAVLIPYITLGYPTLERSLALAEAAIEGGADILELGIPFSDPLADGPVIQRATHMALENGTTVSLCLELASRLRSKYPQIPLVFMGYLNPILAFGEASFCQSCRESGVDGLIIPDLPPEEGKDIEGQCRENGLALIYLAAPNTPDARLRNICEHSRGYVYLVSVTGTTGAREGVSAELPAFVARVKAMTKTPVAVGFGISTPENAAEVAAMADGVIVGSAVVQRCASERAESDVKAFVSELRHAMKR
jgi:tryptophan synthase alpha chain